MDIEFCDGGNLAPYGETAIILPSFTMGFMHLRVVQDFVQRSHFYGLLLLMMYDTILYTIACLFVLKGVSSTNR